MGLLDGFTPPTTTPAAPLAPSTPPVSTGGLLAGLSTPAAPKLSTSNSQGGYFSAKLDDGSTVGFSDQKDIAGKPFFAYRNPGDNATTTDMTRVATTFDPRQAQTLSRSQLTNGRLPSSVSQPIKQALGGNYSDELDHTISLELSGSNDKSNLRVETGRTTPGGVSSNFDKEENSLARAVVSGKMSLWDAQYKLAEDKHTAGDNNPLPWVDKPTATNALGTFLSSTPKTPAVPSQKPSNGLLEGLEGKLPGANLGAAPAPVSDQTKPSVATIVPKTPPQIAKIADAFKNVFTPNPKLQSAVDKVVAQVSTPTPLIPHTVKADWTDVLNVVPQLIGNLFFEPAVDAFSSLYQTATGQPLKIQVPAFGTDRGNFINSQSSQDFYNAQLDSGASPKKAFWTTAVKTVGDMAVLVPLVRDLSKITALSISPESMVDKEGISLNKETLNDFLSGRKTAEELKLPKEAQDVIADTLKNGTRAEKIKMIQGIDITKVKPSLFGKFLGLGQEEADSLINKLTKIIPPAPEGTEQLPGYRVRPGQAHPIGLSLQEVEPVGFGDEGPKKGSTSEIPNDLKPLAEEAKKYKSAEEFVKAQPTLYHGTNVDFEKFDLSKSGEVQPADWGEGAYFTDNPKQAQSFAKVAGGNKVMERFAPDVKFADGAKLVKDHDFQLALDNGMDTGAAKDYLQSKGYDGVKFKNPQGFTEYVVYNADKIITKSQLTDLYNKAVGNMAQDIETSTTKPEESKTILQAAETKAEKLGTSPEKTTNIEQLFRQLDRTRQSLFAAKANPEAHAKAYGENRIPQYEQKIRDLQQRIEAATSAKENPNDVNIGNEHEEVSPADYMPSTNIPRSEYMEGLQIKVDQLKAARDFLVDELKINPVKKLLKYVSSTTGELPEVTGQSTMKSLTGSGKTVQRSTFGQKGDAIVQEIFGAGETYDKAPTVEMAQAAIDAYRKNQEKVKDLAEQLAQAKTLLAQARLEDKDAKSLSSFLKKASKDFGYEINAAATLNEAKEKGYNEDTTADNGYVLPPKVRGNIQSPEFDWSKWKNPAEFTSVGGKYTANLRMNRDTLERNVEKIAPEAEAKAFNKFLPEAVSENEYNKTKALNEIKQKTRAKMAELGIKQGSVESALVQKIGEGMATLDQAARETKNIKQVQQAAEFFRKEYDNIIAQWNMQREFFGYRPVQKIDDYFRHFRDVSWFTETFGFLKDPGELPTSIASKSEFFRPGKPFTTAEMHRTGHATRYDAIEGFNKYVDSVFNQIYHIDSIQRGRAVIKYLEKTAEALELGGQQLPLQAFKYNLDDYVFSSLAGKQAPLDRAVEKFVGRPMVALIHWLGQRVVLNIIVGNISSAMSHLVSIPLNLATTKKIPYAKGIMNTLTSPLRSDPFTSIDGVESKFLVRRYPEGPINPNFLETAEKFGMFLMDTGDKFKSHMAVSGKFYEGIEKGLTPEEAMKEADNYAGRVIGDYSKGRAPNIFNNKTLKFLAPFQLGLNDSYSVLVHDIPYQNKGEKLKIFGKLLQYAIFAYLMNTYVYKKSRGAGKGIDPIDWGLTLTGLNTEGKDQTVLNRIKLAATDAAGELPFTSIFTGSYPLAQALPKATDIFTSDLAKWKSNAEKFAADFLSPVGGGTQVAKTLQGISDYRAGEVVSGKKTTHVEKSVGNLIKGAVFGPSSLTSQAAANKSNARVIPKRVVPKRVVPKR